MKKFSLLPKIICTVVLVWGVFTTTADAAVLQTVSGSFTSTNGDDAHNFSELENKLDTALPDLYQQGHNPQLTNVTVTITERGGVFTTSYSVTIEDSTNGRAWVGFTARGSFGNTPSTRCPADPTKQNYQIRADGQISGCENSDGRSLATKLTQDLSAGEVKIIKVYDNPTLQIKEYFVSFTKPIQYPPFGTQPINGPTGGTQQTNPFDTTTSSDPGDGTSPQAGSVEILSCSNTKLRSLFDILIWVKCIIAVAVVPLIFSLAFLVFLWGVFKLMTASDVKGKQEGQKVIWWGILGLFVMVSLWGILKILGTTLGIDATVVPTLQTK